MTKPKRVDFLNNNDDLQTLVLGRLGFSTSFISERTGLSYCQVLYRLGKQHVRRSDYRNGRTDDLPLILGAVETRLRRQVRDSLANGNGERK